MAQVNRSGRDPTSSRGSVLGDDRLCPNLLPICAEKKLLSVFGKACVLVGGAATFVEQCSQSVGERVDGAREYAGALVNGLATLGGGAAISVAQAAEVAPEAWEQATGNLRHAAYAALNSLNRYCAEPRKQDPSPVNSGPNKQPSPSGSRGNTSASQKSTEGGSPVRPSSLSSSLSTRSTRLSGDGRPELTIGEGSYTRVALFSHIDDIYLYLLKTDPYPKAELNRTYTNFKQSPTDSNWKELKTCIINCGINITGKDKTTEAYKGSIGNLCVVGNRILHTPSEEFDISFGSRYYTNRQTRPDLSTGAAVSTNQIIPGLKVLKRQSHDTNRQSSITSIINTLTALEELKGNAESLTPLPDDWKIHLAKLMAPSSYDNGEQKTLGLGTHNGVLLKRCSDEDKQRLQRYAWQLDAEMMTLIPRKISRQKVPSRQYLKTHILEKIKLLNTYRTKSKKGERILTIQFMIQTLTDLNCALSKGENLPDIDTMKRLRDTLIDEDSYSPHAVLKQNIIGAEKDELQTLGKHLAWMITGMAK